MEHVIDYEHGIFAVDSGYARAQLNAVHVMVERGRVAIIDTAHNAALPRVIQALAAKGLKPEAVDWVLLTHVHLDHAGAAGAMMAQFPNATLAVHPRGARHIIDPTRLMEGTVAVYGEAAARRLYGDVLPVTKDRVREMAHEAAISLAGRELRFLHTPGHARHHLSIVDAQSRHIFAGDTFGLSYREFDAGARQFVFPTSSPVQFDPAELHRSIDLLTQLAPPAIYVTHFGQVRDIPRLASDLHRLIDALAAIALRFCDAGSERNALIRDAVEALALEEARLQDWPVERARVLEVLGADIALNASGLECWLDARAN